MTIHAMSWSTSPSSAIKRFGCSRVRIGKACRRGIWQQARRRPEVFVLPAASCPGRELKAFTGHRQGRVERWRGGLGEAYPCPALSSTGASLKLHHAPFPPPAHRTGRAVFPHPALGPDHSCVRPRKVTRQHREPYQSQRLVQIRVGDSWGPTTSDAMLAPQPLAEPAASSSNHRSKPYFSISSKVCASTPATPRFSRQRW